MADFGFSLNTEELPEPRGEFEPIEGTFDVVSHSAKVETESNGALALVMRLDVEGPTHQGRVIFDRIIIQSPSKGQEDYGRRQLAEVCRVIGHHGNISNSDQVVGHRMKVKTVIEKSEGYKPKTKVVQRMASTSDGGYRPPIAPSAPVASKPPFKFGGAK